MRYLLDTHCFLWNFREPGRLSHGARSVLSDPNAALWLSIASIWEIVIKERSGKLTLPEPVSDFVDSRMTALGCAVLAIEQPHLRVLASLDMHHRDPFDRMLVAQAKHEDMTLVTVTMRCARMACRSSGRSSQPPLDEHDQADLHGRRARRRAR